VVVCAPTDKAIPSAIAVARENNFISPPFLVDVSLEIDSSDSIFAGSELSTK